MKDLSIIIPHCNEYPQAYFTVCNLRCELERSRIDWEIATIANRCSKNDRSYERFQTLSEQKNSPFLALEYNDSQSHWCAKNVGVQNTTGRILFFIDSHCIVTKNALVNMYNYYVEHEEELHGTLHAPLLYMNERSGAELEYKLVANITDDVQGVHGNIKNTPHNLGYVFTRVRNNECHRVSCMSTCGMMISRDLLVNQLGMWPWSLSAYGGGENFINFTLAVMGYHMHVFSRENSIHHYAEKRGYPWNYDGWIKNRIIAAYMNGGEEWARVFALNSRGKRAVLEQMLNETVESCQEQRKTYIEPNLKMTPQEWVQREVAEGRSKETYW